MAATNPSLFLSISMQFVASATLKRTDLAGLLARWRQHGTGEDPFCNIILTPLPGLSERSTVDYVRENFVGRSRIWFDSGGYFVQQREIAYEDLYRRLLEWYRNNHWADVYVLPDYVPSSDLNSEEVQARVHATISVARLFSADLPPDIRARALPVAQGYTREQVWSCIETYLDLGYRTIGFGSFDTTGSGADINLLTRRAILNLEFLQELSVRHGFRIHAFGVGTPALIPTLFALGVSSFDSSCWIRTAGFGNVLLPFIGRRNISQGMLREIGGPAYDAASFSEAKERTGHECPFCESFERLQRDRLDQALHNLIVIRDSVAALERGLDTLSASVQGVIYNSRYARWRREKA
jgi:queuine/archaeosine tRNA-ribosyltransferase